MSEILRLSDNVKRNESHLSLHEIDGELLMIAQNQQDKETVAIYLHDLQVLELLIHLSSYLDKKEHTSFSANVCSEKNENVKSSIAQQRGENQNGKKHRFIK
ncbi:hypothetical protein [Enterococcus gallinarum]|uniref:hypothetical protein n=1 Tax=Enterococcus gallinarum TaxID=1353 RepID=UPI001AD6ED87|nr:hypothetical protein [Enterococcus gallinarum]